jgi:hypothetical protein
MLGTVPRSTRQTILFPKINWRVNGRNQVVLQYNSMRRTAEHGVLGGATETARPHALLANCCSNALAVPGVCDSTSRLY